MKKRIGLFGGTFSPPHRGHVHAASVFLEKEALDELIIMPTFLPPHKTMEGDATPEMRLEMCRLAFSFDSRITVSDLEILRGGKSYTADTLETLSEKYGRLIFLTGTDMFLTLDAWKRPETIFRLADIVCIPRENDAETMKKIRQKEKEYKDAFHATVRVLDTDAVELSATDCRTLAENGGKLSDVLTPEVEEYIRKWKLYR